MKTGACDVEPSKLDQVYKASGDGQMRAAYDDWADQYDADVEGQGYRTPDRIAAALARFAADRSDPVMDFGCGTGLSGSALERAGFSNIDGADLSAGMLDIARARDVYANLHLVEPGQAFAFDLSAYQAITAAGVISKGAAPARVFGELIEPMAPGALLVFSLNDLSTSDPEYADLVSDAVKAGQVALLFEKHGPHLESYGKNSGSTVFVLERI